jgi:putative MFS transporter
MSGVTSHWADAGGRLDRLPIGRFHRRLLTLIGAGMFFDGFDLYLAGSVMGALVASGFSTMALNGWFTTSTIVGMMIGAFSAMVEKPEATSAPMTLPAR